MDKTARLAVRFGPDQGQMFSLTTELVRIGRGDDNEIVLSDPGLSEHHASIVHKDGRYAIVTTHPAGLQIDETPIPPERWIWLPDEASIRISPLTVLKFEREPGPEGERAESAIGSETGTITLQPTPEALAPGSPPVSVKAPPRAGAARPRRAAEAAPVARSAPVAEADPGAETSTVPGSSERVARSRKGSDKKGRHTARFITDGPGESLVKLGEDGHLPELALAESAAAGQASNQKHETNPLVLIGALVASLSLTLVMLFMDETPARFQTQDKASARRELREYFVGEEDESLAPYQLALRRSRQAWARGDIAGERAELRRVLRMLRSEAKDKLQRFSGLTGRLDYDYDDASKRSDRRLEELIAALLADD